MESRLLSLVIPLLNEEGNLKPLYHELIPILTSLQHFNNYELIFVNDGSTDTSLSILKELAALDPQVKIISFTRNFGHEHATYAGMIHAQGDAVVLIDADRQDPPALIAQFEQEFLKGHHIVYGQRSKRENESWFKKLTSKAFYPLFKFLTKVDMPRDVGDFCLLSRKAINCFKQLPEKTLFIRGMIYWSGLSKKAVPFVRRSRGEGTSKYNYWKLTVFALENIISFSTFPIYVMLFLATLAIGFCLLGTGLALFMNLFGYVIMTGWTSLMICMLFLFASTLFFISLIGLYIGKIFQEVKGRPVFLIDEKINFTQQVKLSVDYTPFPEKFVR
ncbi:glycosyltransferase family 2 protein [Candidatus Babeliales bacterium]|nr:glycosyltransferase family 2 protein [Candidatus Babeliales bacterium]